MGSLNAVGQEFVLITATGYHAMLASDTVEFSLVALRVFFSYPVIGAEKEFLSAAGTRMAAMTCRVRDT